MRFAPAATALSLAFALTASVSWGNERNPEPRAGVLIAQGQAALEAGDTQGAIDAFEAALAVDPGHTPIFIRLAEAARAENLQGKAIRYYREALDRDPKNLAALAGEGAALAEKGAVEKARAKLAEVRSLCGDSCTETQRLTAAIAAGPRTPVLTAEAKLPEAQPVQSN
ncbi:tetratricopeptide repeat protein [Qipengyuania gaetbuli]|uniref:Tetratricopeptide repeat protein n=1 Tax=Qipengyuania gaetbuli TaxID=266952 RepID=A0A844XYU3_9SPHN|nr:tetratricopeptide repeat protein [Qipengyuania gaetbuli]MBY6013873.1 tetratricopeptide repeat protein [Qipengyuania gaetbuli]MXO50357.1 tetratricopeptide repeat protein [Qipengyuania gaetbuli]